MIDAEAFQKMTGRPPFEDDLDRVNCRWAGRLRHLMCGVCPKHKKPRFVCGCTIMPVLGCT